MALLVRSAPQLMIGSAIFRFDPVESRTAVLCDTGPIAC